MTALLGVDGLVVRYPVPRGLVRTLARRPRLDRELVGCPFAPRCDRRFEPCGTLRPTLRALDDGHAAACHLNGVG